MANTFIDKVSAAPVVGTTFDNSTVRALRPQYIFDAVCQEKRWNISTPPKRYDTIQFPVLAALSANTATPDVTAVTPNSDEKASYSRRTVTLDIYGRNSIIDLAELDHEAYVDEVADASFNLTDQGMNSLNDLARTAMDLNTYANETSGTLSSTYHGYGSYGIGSGTAGPLKAVTVREVVASLRGDNVKTYPDGLYWWIITPQQYTQLRADSDNAAWSKIYESGTNELANAIMRGNPDVFEGMRFLMNNQVTGAGTGTLSSYAFGREFVGKAIGYDLRTGTDSKLWGKFEHLLSIYWTALVGYKIIRREAGRIIETVATVQ
jgi:hypothetical protein